MEGRLVALFLRKYVRYYEDVVEAENDDEALGVFMPEATMVVDTGYLIEDIVEVTREKLKEEYGLELED
jgi:hypothetical protein